MRLRLLFLLAAVGLVAGLFSAYVSARQPPAQPPAFDPASNPYANGIYANASSRAARAKARTCPSSRKYRAPWPACSRAKATLSKPARRC